MTNAQFTALMLMLTGIWLVLMSIRARLPK